MGSPFCQRQGCVLSQENWGGRYAKSDHLEDVSGKRGAKAGAKEVVFIAGWKAGDIHEVIMEYSWDINNVNIRMVISFIHDIFMGYSWDIHGVFMISPTLCW